MYIADDGALELYYPSKVLIRRAAAMTKTRLGLRPRSNVKILWQVRYVTGIPSMCNPQLLVVALNTVAIAFA